MDSYSNNRKSYKKKRDKAINTTLIIICVLCLLAGVILLLIDPIKSWKRETITSDAVDLIESQISENSQIILENADPTEITIVVPKNGNEVAGEEYDIYSDDEEEILSIREQIQAEEDSLPNNVTLTCVGLLQIDKIDLNLPIWDSSNRVALRYGLGLYEGSVVPGQTGNSTILGHRNRNTQTIFWQLYKVHTGDKVRVVLVSGEVLTFKVVKDLIVAPKDLMKHIVADASNQRQLTLLTCATEYGQGYRRLLVCKLVSEKFED